MYQLNLITVTIFTFLVKQQETCLTMLLHLKEQNKQILAYLNENQNRKQNQISLPDLGVDFPLNTYEQLKLVEEKLENQDASSVLVSLSPFKFLDNKLVFFRPHTYHL